MGHPASCLIETENAQIGDAGTHAHFQREHGFRDVAMTFVTDGETVDSRLTYVQEVNAFGLQVSFRMPVRYAFNGFDIRLRGMTCTLPSALWEVRELGADAVASHILR